jgi:hypothetical protein
VTPPFNSSHGLAPFNQQLRVTGWYARAEFWALAAAAAGALAEAGLKPGDAQVHSPSTVLVVVGTTWPLNHYE